MNIQKLEKKMYKLKRDRKAVSPVISTIIIVAIAIAISIAVALYLTGITGTFTKFERLDVTSAYVDANSKVQITVKNSGTSILSIDRVMENGVPLSPTGGVGWTTSPSTDGTTQSNPSITLDGSGSSSNVIQIVQGDTGSIQFAISGKSGQSIELTLHTVSGKEYPKVVVLP